MGQEMGLRNKITSMKEQPRHSNSPSLARIGQEIGGNLPMS